MEMPTDVDGIPRRAGMVSFASIVLLLIVITLCGYCSLTKQADKEYNNFVQTYYISMKSELLMDQFNRVQTMILSHTNDLEFLKRSVEPATASLTRDFEQLNISIDQSFHSPIRDANLNRMHKAQPLLNQLLQLWHELITGGQDIVHGDTTQRLSTEYESLISELSPISITESEYSITLQQSFQHLMFWSRVFVFLALPIMFIFSVVSIVSTIAYTRKIIAMHSRLSKLLDDAQALELKRTFVASISHEIRTPMNGILAMSHLLQQTVLHDDQRDMVNTIVESAEQLMQLVNDILLLRKMELDKFTLSPTWFSCQNLFEQIILLYTAQARLKQQQLELVWDCSETSNNNKEIFADLVRLKQVMCNLLDNAIKFTPNHGRITVFVDTTPDPKLNSENEIMNVKVQDTGIGIASETIDRIFEPFTQADVNTSREFGGTGLGLAISRQLVRQMGGELHVVSQPGQGSTFSFSVSFPIRYLQPLHNEVKQDDVQINIDEPSTTPLPRKLRVLLVEDNVINQKVAIRMIRRQGHNVTIACDGKDAVDKFTSLPNQFDVVLMDINMPVMDGYAATSEIRRYELQQPGCLRVPIVAVTACITEDDLRKIKAVGMDHVLAKPITPKALLGTFDALQR